MPSQILGCIYIYRAAKNKSRPIPGFLVEKGFDLHISRGLLLR